MNRGDLFEVNDTTFSLFREIELGMRDRLSAILESSSVEADQKDRLVKLVCEDDDVQFYWSMLSVDIDTEHNASLLLKEIVELWLTIRGFSIAGQWLEIYKNNKALTTKKSKSLHKTLKRGETSKSSTSSHHQSHLHYQSHLLPTHFVRLKIRKLHVIIRSFVKCLKRDTVAIPHDQQTQLHNEYEYIAA